MRPAALFVLHGNGAAQEALVQGLRAGQSITVTYIPGHGTQIKAGAAEDIVLPGKDFAGALFSVWLGNRWTTS